MWKISLIWWSFWELPRSWCHRSAEIIWAHRTQSEKLSFISENVSVPLDRNFLRYEPSVLKRRVASLLSSRKWASHQTQKKKLPSLFSEGRDVWVQLHSAQLSPRAESEQTGWCSGGFYPRLPVLAPSCCRSITRISAAALVKTCRFSPMDYQMLISGYNFTKNKIRNNFSD